MLTNKVDDKNPESVFSWFIEKVDHTHQREKKKFKWQGLRIDIMLNNAGSHTFYVLIWYPMNGSLATGQWTTDTDLFATQWVDIIG